MNLMKFGFSSLNYVQDVGRENEAIDPKGTSPAAIPERKAGLSLECIFGNSQFCQQKGMKFHLLMMSFTKLSIENIKSCEQISLLDDACRNGVE